VKNQILFAACRNPQNMVILSARDGKILDALPLAGGCDGAVTQRRDSLRPRGTRCALRYNRSFIGRLT